MVIAMLIIMAFLYGLIVATATPSDKDEYEAYQRWKERRKNNGAR